MLVVSCVPLRYLIVRHSDESGGLSTIWKFLQELSDAVSFPLWK